MVSAIGSPPIFNTAATSSVASTAGIEAQIARDQKELLNCVNCASAETKQGQADIQALTNKISVAKSRLEQVATSNPSDQTSTLNSTAASNTATTISANTIGDISISEAAVNETTEGVSAEGITTASVTTASVTTANEAATYSNAVASTADGETNAGSAIILNASDSNVGKLVDEYV